MFYAALRYHPEHKKLDLGWFETLLDKLSSSAEPQSTVDARKAPKYMPYADTTVRLSVEFGFATY